jgi:uncharacterized protein YukE
MVRIRVNIEDLKENAKDYDSVSGAVNRAGDDILAVAMAMPSYDGQLSGPARKAGYEIQTQCRELKAALSSNAESLRKSAQAFEEVDNRAIDVLSQSQEELASQTPAELKGIDEGNSYLGYRDDGLSETVILCMYGVCRTIPRAGNEELIAKFEEKVDAYEIDKESMLKYFYALIGTSVVATVALIGLTAATAGLATLIAAGGALEADAAAWKAVMDAQENMATDTYGAAYYWNMLFGSTGQAPCMTGDDNQNPIDLQKRIDQPIYEPET